MHYSPLIGDQPGQSVRAVVSAPLKLGAFGGEVCQAPMAIAVKKWCAAVVLDDLVVFT
ncbi:MULTISPECIES: hypothetical protein [unclassified Streptomyces]|uniref:hypothetical protein n=1 Tax=unclassified Streptomyces TaxID=2593676 RepID=UPI00136CEA00|nr:MULTISPECIES: hypothetical protein [unclassified Streptomyces]MYX04228.1 hypothetical protein [Streptomyces sp. SID8378]